MALTLVQAAPGYWNWTPTEDDLSKEWYPKPKRVEQLRENTRVTSFREHPAIGTYPIIDGKWACGRAMGPYRGRFPNGFMERLETLLYCFNLIPDFNPHKTLMLFPFGGSVVKRPNLHTIDIKSVTKPTCLTCISQPSRDNRVWQRC